MKYLKTISFLAVYLCFHFGNTTCIQRIYLDWNNISKVSNTLYKLPINLYIDTLSTVDFDLRFDSAFYDIDSFTVNNSGWYFVYNNKIKNKFLFTSYRLNPTIPKGLYNFGFLFIKTIPSQVPSNVNSSFYLGVLNGNKTCALNYSNVESYCTNKIALPADTSFCKFPSYINSGNNYPNDTQRYDYLWNNTTSPYKKSINSTGNYQLKILYKKLCKHTEISSIKISIKFYDTNKIIKNTVHICEGDTFKNNNHNYYKSGTFYDTFISSSGCDSITKITLKINPKSFYSFKAKLCQNDSIKIFNKWYKKAGNYIDTGLNYLGCDSIITTVITVLTPKFTTRSQWLCNGDTVFVTYSPIFSDTIIKTKIVSYQGCDSFLIDTFHFRKSKLQYVNLTVCEGDSIKIKSNFYKTSCNIIDTLISHWGCDSFVSYNITKINKSQSLKQFEICAGDTLTINNIKYSDSGNYTQYYFNYLGCDSIFKIIIKIKKRTTMVFHYTICSGDSININNFYFHSDTLIYDTLTNQYSCDSFVTYSIELIKKTYSTQKITICEGDSLKVAKKFYKFSGIYIDTFKNYYNCDSIVGTELTVLPKKINSITKSICENDSIFINNKFYSDTGRYILTYARPGYCDSIVLLSLKYFNSDSCFQNNQFFIPTAFTPNHDQLNDIFAINFPGIIYLNIQIFNRWGQKVFETINKSQGWDGTYNGKDCTEGVYSYLITVKTKSNSFFYRNGSLTLLR